MAQENKIVQAQKKAPGGGAAGDVEGPSELPQARVPDRPARTPPRPTTRINPHVWFRVRPELTALEGGLGVDYRMIPLA